MATNASIQSDTILQPQSIETPLKQFLKSREGKGITTFLHSLKAKQAKPKLIKKSKKTASPLTEETKQESITFDAYQ